jgi:hypothetical protein
MSREKLIHITIYLKNDQSTGNDDKYNAAYNVDDDDLNLLFSPHIFPEPFLDWCKDLGNIINVPPDLIRTRLKTYTTTHSVPAHIVAKIEAIANFIDKNIDKYVGIVTVFLRLWIDGKDLFVIF